MKRDIQCIAIDLDDTLLTDDNKVTEENCKAIHEARDKGIYILIATGRMYQTAKPAGLALQLGDVPMILYSGALIQHVESGTIAYEQPIPLSIATKILALAKTHGWYIQSYIDDELLIPSYEERTQRYEEVTGATAKVIGDAYYYPSKGPVKLLAIDSPEHIDAIMTVLKREVGDAVTMVRSKETYLEIIAKGTSKGEALRGMMEKMHIPLDKVMAIGNAPNDIPMLSIAGLAVAVGNAEESVKAIAHYVSDTNNNSGVAKAIRELLG